MTLPDGNFDWHALWADLLKGAGRGLLEFDGSRLARAALAGLDAFDAAQESRRSGEPSGETREGGAPSLQAQIASIYPDIELSTEEWAHLARRSPEEQAAWLQEMAEAHRRENGNAHGLSRSVLPKPLSANPYEGWALASTLPFGATGQLNLPTLRR